MKDRLVVSLGGNAFAPAGESMTMLGQFDFAANTLAPLTAILGTEQELLITHGNGPQVGYILTRVEEALGKAYALPLEVCVAESEGEIGYVLQQTVRNLLHGRRPVAALLTQVIVEKSDAAFARATKPVGPWFDAEHAAVLDQAGMALVFDERGRGRRVVPSPRPTQIVELEIIRQLLAQGIIVIAAGGGGIPVVQQGDKLEGVEAVIDKDLSSALLAIGCEADRFVMVTNVPGVYTDYGGTNARLVAHTRPSELRAWTDAGHFPAGTMGPKVEAAIQYVEATGNPAVICQPEDLGAALVGQAGTVVTEEQHV